MLHSVFYLVLGIGALHGFIEESSWPGCLALWGYLTAYSDGGAFASSDSGRGTWKTGSHICNISMMMSIDMVRYQLQLVGSDSNSITVQSHG